MVWLEPGGQNIKRNEEHFNIFNNTFFFSCGGGFELPSGMESTIWDLDNHTNAKHEILKKYLNAWFPILGGNNYHNKLLYIDGFAGPGEYSNGEKGSPIHAIESLKNQVVTIKAKCHFIFIENDEKRCRNLELILSKIEIPSNADYSVICSDFSDHLSGVFDELDKQGRSLAPSFVMVDPFGYSQTPFHIIKKIMSYKRCEVLITFMYDFINRFKENSDAGPKIDELYGSNIWRNSITIDDPNERKRYLLNAYIEQLENEADVKYVRHFEMKNKFNHTPYFLIYCTNHIKGLEVMKDAMWSVDTKGTFTFSDRTDPNQLVLFEHKPDFKKLKQIILYEYKGRKIKSEDLKDFVIEKTPFKASHYKKQILQPMEESDPPEIIVSNRKKIKSYPNGSIIEFL